MVTTEQETPGRATVAQRWLARLSLVATAAAAVLVPLLAIGLRASLAVAITGVVGLVLAAAGVWWALTNRGLVRWLAVAVAVLAPLVVLVLYTSRGLLWVVVVVVALGLLALAVAAGRAALAREVVPERMREYDVPPPRRPFLIMNPRSGGGKVTRFGLKDKAEALGAEVALPEGPGTVDVGELARRAVADGADLLGVAGGDGTQAMVAGIAAEHDIPLLVISAGTRNHFALDLGLDRDDPSRCLEALTDGVELQVDLGIIAGRPFVNNASFGAYAAIVQSPAYRDDKARTTLDQLPGLLAGHEGPRLVARAVSVPLPPLKRSAPDPPVSRSLPVPPPRLSAPPPPDRVSSPPSPHSRSLPSSPVAEEFADEVRQAVASSPTPVRWLVVAAEPIHLGEAQVDALGRKLPVELL